MAVSFVAPSFLVVDYGLFYRTRSGSLPERERSELRSATATQYVSRRSMSLHYLEFG